MLFEFSLLFVLTSSIECQSVFKQEANPKLCNFFDTINITGGIQNSDGSITFNEIQFAAAHYGTFTYMYSANQEKISVPAHIRGCVCKYKNCVRLCCPQGHVIYDMPKCVPNNAVTGIHLKYYDNMVFVSEKPCDAGYLLDPTEPMDKWTVALDGSLIIGEGSVDSLLFVDHDEYCLAYLSDNSTGEFTTNVMLCTDADPAHEVQIIGSIVYPVMMLVSIVFLSLTFFLYCWIQRLRTLHGKIFMCYLASLIIGYSALALGLFTQWHAHKGPTSCVILAEITHTAFIGGFIWLGLIGYNLWREVGGAKQRTNQFLKYFLFACGTTFIIVSITNLLDHTDLLVKNLRPGLGTAQCWLQDTKYAHFIYLYSIVIVILTLNTVFFVLTKRKVELTRKFLINEGFNKCSLDETNADRYYLFSRLFIVFGLPWFIEIISWLTGTDNIIIYIMDIFTLLMGPVIFFMCIKKPRVKRLMSDKWVSMTTVPATTSS